jgi:hypothetical protein
MAITSNYVPAPAPSKQTLASAYIDFTGGSNDWAQQYLPDLMEQEAEVFGDRTISGFLSMVGAEESMTADQVVWSEQGRLHLAYEVTFASGPVFNVDKDADGAVPAAYSSADTSKAHGIRPGDMLVVATATKTFTAYATYCLCYSCRR